MTEEDPCYKGECPDAVDYDYELDKLLGRDQSEAAQEVSPLEARTGATSRRRLASVLMLVLALTVGGAYFAGARSEDHREMAGSNPISNDRPVWVDDFDPTAPLPPIVTPRPSLVPSVSPGVTPTRCANPPGSKPSYRAVAAIVMGPYGPMTPPFGYIGMTGPESLPPVFVEREKLNWWWNWRSGPNGCYEYYLDQYRLN